MEQAWQEHGKKYIIFEGADCVGKTTLIKALSEKLDCLVVKEPGGSTALITEGFNREKLGEAYGSFREQCVNNPDIPEQARRAIFLADSIMQWNKVTKPALDAGKLVLSDRSWISDLAYGSVLSSLSIPELYTFNHIIAARGMGHVIYLYLSEEERLKRHTVVNLMDHTDAVRVDKAYHVIFNAYFEEEEVTFLCTDEPVEVLVEKVLRLLNDSSSL